MIRTAKKLLPPEAIRLIKHTAGYGSHLRGDFSTWEDAVKNAQGYTADNIIELAIRSARDCQNGKGFSFVSPYTIGGIIRAAANTNKLRVIDFGGALGNTYFHFRHTISIALDWIVIEQPHYVMVGQNEFNEDNLSFCNSLLEIEEPDVILFSGVLQYLPNPGEIIRQALDRKPRFIIIDRHPVVSGSRDIISIQKQNPPFPIVSSYPIRLFSKSSLIEDITQHYNLILEFKALDAPMGGLRKVTPRGFIFELKERLTNETN